MKLFKILLAVRICYYQQLLRVLEYVKPRKLILRYIRGGCAGIYPKMLTPDDCLHGMPSFLLGDCAFISAKLGFIKGM